MSANQTRKPGTQQLLANLGMATSFVMHQLRSDLNKDAAYLQNPEEFSRQISSRLLPMIEGIKTYNAYDRDSKLRDDTEEIWRQGQVSIYKLKSYSYKKERPVLLLVPSVINRDYVFHLTPQRSLLKWLSEKEINVFILSWGKPAKDGALASLETLITQRLCAAIDALKERYAQKVHLLGYCLGGTLSVASAYIKPENVKSVIMLAAPWNFHGEETLKKALDFWATPLRLSGAECVSAAQIRSVFSSLAAEKTIEKFSRFKNMDKNSEQAELFVAVEDWLNDGVDLPHTLVRDCITLWFEENKTHKGQWAVGGHNINMDAIKAPVFSIASSQDTLVPMEMTPCFAQNKNNRKKLDTKTGHIGMIAGSKTIEKVWQPIAKWVEEIK